jgi:hypothetical protein
MPSASVLSAAAFPSRAVKAKGLRNWRPQVDRLLNLRHATRVDHVDRAFHALGARVSVDVSAEDEG